VTALPKLDLGIDYGARSTWKFRTRILRSRKGTEQRIRQGKYPIWEFQVGDREIGITQLNIIENFISAVQGRKISFRYKNWLDYQVTNEEIAIADGIETKFQIAKTYGFSNPLTIPITLPVEGTLTVTVGGVRVTNWTCNWDSGIITFAVAPANTLAIAVTCQFDILCKLAQEVRGHSFEAWRASDRFGFYKLGNIQIKQVR